MSTYHAWLQWLHTVMDYVGLAIKPKKPVSLLVTLCRWSLWQDAVAAHGRDLFKCP